MWWVNWTGCVKCTVLRHWSHNVGFGHVILVKRRCLNWIIIVQSSRTNFVQAVMPTLETKPHIHILSLGTHLSSHSIIMQPHTGMDVFVGLAGIQEVPRELLSKFHIRAAAAPLPGVLGPRKVGGEVLHDAVYHTLPPVDGFQLQAVQFDTKGFLISTSLLVTAARLQFAHGAGVGHCMYHSSCCDGVRKGTFSKTCAWRERQWC